MNLSIHGYGFDDFEGLQNLTSLEELSLSVANEYGFMEPYKIATLPKTLDFLQNQDNFLL